MGLGYALMTLPRLAQADGKSPGTRLSYTNAPRLEAIAVLRKIKMGY